GQNNGQNNGYNGQSNGQPQRQPDQDDSAHVEEEQTSGAFDVAESSQDDDSALVVDTPESQDGAEPAPKPRNTRKPRAPKPEGEADAPKPRRAPRKPRAPRAEGDSTAPELKSSAAE
ncbi:MAG: hypothetical protein JXQ79_09115, partial [Rhodobacteraceae bacterium]|nr:hypothetical protein [Paracoccaceae bacterium]